MAFSSSVAILLSECCDADRGGGCAQCGRRVVEVASFQNGFICSWLLCQREATLVRAENTSLGVEGASESAVDPEHAHVRKERR